jgi:hypothetical protein
VVTSGYRWRLFDPDGAATCTVTGGDLMSRRSKLLIAGALVLLAVACGAWAWFLSGKTLNDADKWSSIMAGFAGLLLGAGGLLTGVLALRQTAGTDKQTPPPEPGSRNVDVRRDNAASSSGDPTRSGRRPGPEPQIARTRRPIGRRRDNTGVIITGDDNTVTVSGQPPFSLRPLVPAPAVPRIRPQRPAHRPA